MPSFQSLSETKIRISCPSLGTDHSIHFQTCPGPVLTLPPSVKIESKETWPTWTSRRPLYWSTLLKKACYLDLRSKKRQICWRPWEHTCRSDGRRQTLQRFRGFSIVGGLLPQGNTVSFPLTDKVLLQPSYFRVFLRENSRQGKESTFWHEKLALQIGTQWAALQMGSREDCLAPR